MIMIKDLGPRVRKTSNKTDRWGVFECDICKCHLEYPISNGKKGIMCNSCRGKLSATKHNMCKTPQYRSWAGMKQRCKNENDPGYQRYGKRGIKYCDKWETFQGFWEDMEDGYFEGGTIDRIENDLGYYKENCQWLTKSENSTKDQLKCVIQYRVEGKEKVYVEALKTWPSIKEAATELKLLESKIGKVCQDKGFTHGGFGWKFANNNL